MSSSRDHDSSNTNTTQSTTLSLTQTQTQHKYTHRTSFNIGTDYPSFNGADVGIVRHVVLWPRLHTSDCISGDTIRKRAAGKPEERLFLSQLYFFLLFLNSLRERKKTTVLLSPYFLLDLERTKKEKKKV